MKRIGIGIVAAALLAACASATIDDRDFGLAKGSVFDAATPSSYALGAGAPAARPLATPPVIPHAVDDPPPISASANACTDCHGRPATGAKVAKGEAVPAPADHRAGGAAGGVVSGAFWNCTSCHAAQAPVPALVGNP